MMMSCMFRTGWAGHQRDQTNREYSSAPGARDGRWNGMHCIILSPISTVAFCRSGSEKLQGDRIHRAAKSW